MTEQKKVINIPKEELQRTTCKWARDIEHDDSWEGSCGIKWVFTYWGPLENKVNYCPRCGKKVEV